MKVKVEREVSSCSQCPYFRYESDMGARIPICSQLGILGGSYYDIENKINSKCPFLDKPSDKR